MARTLPAGAMAAGLVVVGDGTALTTALSVVSLLATLLLLRSVRLSLRAGLPCGRRHRRTVP